MCFGVCVRACACVSVCNLHLQTLSDETLEFSTPIAENGVRSDVILADGFGVADIRGLILM